MPSNKVFSASITSLSIARFIPIVSALLTAMILTRVISEEYFGQYRSIWLLFSLIGPVAFSSLSGLLYYRAGVVSPTKAITESAFWALGFSVLFALITLPFAKFWVSLFNIPEQTRAFVYFSFYMCGSAFTTILEPMLVTMHRKKWLVYYNTISTGVEFFIVVVPFILGYTIETVTFWLALLQTMRVLFLIACIQKFRWVSWSLYPWVLREWKISSNYLFGLIGVAVAGVFAIQMDTWIIRLLVENDAQFAVYSVGARKIPFLSAITSSITSVLVVLFAAGIRKGEAQALLQLIGKITTNLFVLLIPVLLVVYLYSEEMMVLLFDKYQASAPIFRIYIMTTLLSFIFADTILLAAGNSKWVALAGFFEILVNAPLSILLFYAMGITGPAWATFISHCIYVIIVSVVAKKIINTSTIAKYVFPISSISKEWVKIIPLIIGLIYIKYIFEFSFIAFGLSIIGTLIYILIGHKPMVYSLFYFIRNKSFPE